MAIPWPQMEANIINFFITKSSRSIEDSAQFFADEYKRATRLAQDPVGNYIIADKADSDIIKQGFLEAFSMNMKSPVDLKAIPWVKVSEALVKYWTLMPLFMAIPHPPATSPVPTLIPPPNLITFPGNVGSVTPGIWKAWKEPGESATAKALVNVFKKHTNSLSGIYTGLSGVSPVVVPWKGLK